MDARQLITETREHLAIVEKRMIDHPYLAALETKRYATERLRVFPGEQRYIISSDLRSIGLLINRHAHLPSRDYLLALLAGEASALETVNDLAAGLGMSRDDLLAYEPMPGCQAYPAYVAWLAAYGSDADFAAAFLVNLPAWGAACGRVSAALRSQYGLDETATAFLDAFAAPAEGFEESSLEVIQAGLDRGLDPKTIARAARMIQAYELQYWDTLYEASEA
jgi:thiaminase